MNELKFKREKICRCNICLQIKEMTWDHIPPKGGIELTSMQINEVLSLMTNNASKPKISQNGVKYRFICKECNSKLGKYYDPALNDFALSVGRYLHSRTQFPPVITVQVRPQAIIRSILGHFLATKQEIDNTDFDKQVRKFLFNENELLPDDIHVFYFLYPYTTMVLMRDFAMPACRNGDFSKSGFFQLLKYFPIAYIVTDLNEYEGLPELSAYRNLAVYDQVEIPVFLFRIQEMDWPEKVENTNIILGSKETSNGILAWPKK